MKRAGESAAAERVRREKELLGKLYALKDGARNDAQLAEYWDVVGGSTQKRTWANDAAQGPMVRSSQTSNPLVPLSRLAD